MTSSPVEPRSDASTRQTRPHAATPNTEGRVCRFTESLNELRRVCRLGRIGYPLTMTTWQASSSWRRWLGPTRSGKPGGSCEPGGDRPNPRTDGTDARRSAQKNRCPTPHKRSELYYSVSPYDGPQRTRPAIRPSQSNVRVNVT